MSPSYDMPAPLHHSNPCYRISYQEPEPEVPDEACRACLMILEYGLSESDADSLQPCYDGHSEKDEDEDYRDELVMETVAPIIMDPADGDEGKLLQGGIDMNS